MSRSTLNEELNDGPIMTECTRLVVDDRRECRNPPALIKMLRETRPGHTHRVLTQSHSGRSPSGMLRERKLLGSCVHGGILVVLAFSTWTEKDVCNEA